MPMQPWQPDERSEGKDQESVSKHQTNTNKAGNSNESVVCGESQTVGGAMHSSLPNNQQVVLPAILSQRAGSRRVMMFEPDAGGHEAAQLPKRMKHQPQDRQGSAGGAMAQRQGGQDQDPKTDFDPKVLGLSVPAMPMFGSVYPQIQAQNACSIPSDQQQSLSPLQLQQLQQQLFQQHHLQPQQIQQLMQFQPQQLQQLQQQLQHQQHHYQPNQLQQLQPQLQQQQPFQNLSAAASANMQVRGDSAQQSMLFQSQLQQLSAQQIQQLSAQQIQQLAMQQQQQFLLQAALFAGHNPNLAQTLVTQPSQSQQASQFPELFAQGGDAFSGQQLGGNSNADNGVISDGFASLGADPDSMGLAAVAASQATSDYEATRTRTGRSSVILYMTCDDEALSEYQCLVRKNIELFEASERDVESNAQGRNRPIVMGQVGIRCCHCSVLPPKHRARGAVYYPAKLEGLYQAAQNQANAHLAEHCNHIPAPTREELLRLKDRKSSAGGGKKYWADGVRVSGVIEDTHGLRFEQR